MPRVIIYHRESTHPSSRMAEPTALDVPTEITGQEILELFHLSNDHNLYVIINGRVRWDLPVEFKDVFEIVRDREFFHGPKA